MTLIIDPILRLRRQQATLDQAFQAAVFLTEYDTEQTDDGKILVNEDKFQAVIEFSSSFNKITWTHSARTNRRGLR